MQAGELHLPGAVPGAGVQNAAACYRSRMPACVCKLAIKGNTTCHSVITSPHRMDLLESRRSCAC
jgi:hypothetical protein